MRGAAVRDSRRAAGAGQPPENGVRHWPMKNSFAGPTHRGRIRSGSVLCAIAKMDIPGRSRAKELDGPQDKARPTDATNARSGSTCSEPRASSTMPRDTERPHQAAKSRRNSSSL